MKKKRLRSVLRGNFCVSFDNLLCLRDGHVDRMTITLPKKFKEDERLRVIIERKAKA